MMYGQFPPAKKTILLTMISEPIIPTQILTKRPAIIAFCINSYCKASNMNNFLKDVTFQPHKNVHYRLFQFSF